MRNTLQNGAARTTIWPSYSPKAFCYTRSKDLLLGHNLFVGKYEGYLDNSTPYRVKYYTNYFDFGSPTALKILKKVNITFVGGNGADVTIKYGFDYGNNYLSRKLELGTLAVAEYGVSEYSLSEYTAGVVFDNKTVQASGTGNVLQLGVETLVDGSSISIQKIDCYVKAGRTR